MTGIMNCWKRVKTSYLLISHDIRGPLNIIYGYVELAKDTRDRKRRNHHWKISKRSANISCTC